MHLLKSYWKNSSTIMFKKNYLKNSLRNSWKTQSPFIWKRFHFVNVNLNLNIGNKVCTQISHLCDFQSKKTTFHALQFVRFFICTQLWFIRIFVHWTEQFRTFFFGNKKFPILHVIRSRNKPLGVVGTAYACRCARIHRRLLIIRFFSDNEKHHEDNTNNLYQNGQHGAGLSSPRTPSTLGQTSQVN